MKGINLLKKSAIETKDVTDKSRKAVTYSIVILIFFALINLAIFIYRWNQNQLIGKLNNQIIDKENQISSLKNIEIKYYLIKEKASFLTNMAKDKLDIPVILSFFNQIENLGVKLEAISFQPGKIDIGGTTPDSETLSNALILIIENDQGKNLFKSVSLNGLSLNKDGKFRFDLNLTPQL